MDIYVLEKNTLNIVGIIDQYISLIWTIRYCDVGDFELYLPIEIKYISILKPDNILVRHGDSSAMIIKDIKIETDYENGDRLTVTGKSIESILEQRIVWYQTSLIGRVEDCLIELLKTNLISPIISQRKVNNLYATKKGILTATTSFQTTGDTLLEIIKTQCETAGYGFRITFENNSFQFELYEGTDRSYRQSINPYVIFSDDYENIIDTIYNYQSSTYRNTALVMGEGEGLNRTRTVVGTLYSGYDRHETYVDAKDLSSNKGEISDENYELLLTNRGLEKLLENRTSESFEASLETMKSHTYKVDYFLGDIVQIENEYGIQASAQITEIIETENESGYSIIPTFSNWEVM